MENPKVNKQGSLEESGIPDSVRKVNNIKEKVIRYAVLAWAEKFQRIYPIQGCESYSIKGTLTQRWQGSGRIYLRRTFY